MDILIKNMEMPKNCYECRFHSMQNVMHKACVVHLCYAQEIGQSCNEGEMPTKLHDGCPLVALPSHGRLIDADEFKASIHMNHLGKFATNRDVQVLYKLLNNAETIVEATE